MADSKTSVDPRYSKYSNTEIEELLDKIDAQQTATDADVRAIVTDYSPDDGD